MAWCEPRRSARIARAARNDAALLVGDAVQPARAVIVAVGPHQLAGAFAAEALAARPEMRAFLEQMAALAYEPIVTVWLGYARAVPLPATLARLDDAPGQWVVDRPDILANAQPDPARPPLGQVLAVILSASGLHERLDHHVLAREVDTQLRRLQPTRSPCTWSQVIAERRATVCLHAATARGPARRGLLEASILPGITSMPSTLQRWRPPVRSGIAAARAVMADLAK